MSSFSFRLIIRLTPADAETVKRWAAAALLQAALSELATAEGGTDRVDDAGLEDPQASGRSLHVLSMLRDLCKRTLAPIGSNL